MPPSNYSDFEFIAVPRRFKEYLAAKINVIRQQIVAEGKVQLYRQEANGDVSAHAFNVTSAEKLVNVVSKQFLGLFSSSSLLRAGTIRPSSIFVGFFPNATFF